MIVKTEGVWGGVSQAVFTMYKNTCFGRRGGCLSEVDIGYDQLSVSISVQCGISSVAVVSDNLCSFPGFCIFGFSRYDSDDGDDDEDHDGVDDEDDCDDSALPQ